MATSKPNDLRWWRGKGLAKTIVLLVLLTLGITGFSLGAAWVVRSADRAMTPKIQAVSQQSIAIPNLNGVTYLSGSADRLIQLESIMPAPAACRYWQSLSESDKRGVAFVDAKAVPSCASRRYVKTAAAQHSRRHQETDRSTNYAAYYDLGNPGAPWGYSAVHYSCKDIKGWLKYRYVPPPPAKLTYDQWADLSYKADYGTTSITPKQKAELAQYDEATTALEKYNSTVVGVIEDIYTLGGTFDPGCYPPGVVFGADDTVTFYPSHPVSLLETPAPVFAGLGGSNLIGVGKPYVIQPGDNPSSVATQYYYDWSQWSLIIGANQLAPLIPPKAVGDDYSYNLSQLNWVVGQTIYLPRSPDFNAG